MVTFQHICLARDELSIPSTRYPTTPFPYKEQSVIDDDLKKDSVDLQTRV